MKTSWWRGEQEVRRSLTSGRDIVPGCGRLHTHVPTPAANRVVVVREQKCRDWTPTAPSCFPSVAITLLVWPSAVSPTLPVPHSDPTTPCGAHGLLRTSMMSASPGPRRLIVSVALIHDYRVVE